MNIPMSLPALGEAIEEAIVVRWLRSPGEQVDEGEPLVEVSTDKVDTEIQSPATGLLAEILVAEDESAAVGDVLAILSVADATTSPSEGGPAGELSVSVDTISSAAAPIASAPPPVQAPPSAIRTETVAPSLAPAATSVAANTGTGSAGGPHAPGGSALRGTTQPVTRLRKTIAHRMVQSLQTSAQLTTIVEADVTEVGEARRRHNATVTATEGTKLSYLPFIAVAALAALRDHPQVNSSIDLVAGTITYPDAEHLGVAVDTDKGLFVPVITNAGSLTVVELADRIADVAERTRTNKIGVDELSGGTFTITNTGSRGALGSRLRA